MSSTSSQELVLVEYEYEYTARDGMVVSIRPNERYILLGKTNNHWWQVCKDKNTKPFYVPAQYVKEIPSSLPSPLDSILFAGRVTQEQKNMHADVLQWKLNDVTMRVQPSADSGGKPEIRMSTFGIPQDIHDLARSLKDPRLNERRASIPSKDSLQHTKRHSITLDVLPGSQPAADDCYSLPSKPRVPSFNPADPVVRLIQANLANPTVSKDAEQTESPAEDSQQSDLWQKTENVYESIMDTTDAELKTPKQPEKDPPAAPTPVSDPVSIPALIPVPAPVSALLHVPGPASAQANAESSEIAVYVNIEALRKNIHQSPPAPAVLPHQSLDSEGWEVHTDQESGQEYYYNPVTRQTTWENPFAPHTDPEFYLEDLPPPSPTYSPPSADFIDSNWEKIFDESSGCHYFYNHVTKETSWDPPEELPPPSMEPLDTQTFRQDGPPPLPEEDYLDSPQETGLVLTFPKECHFTRNVIPRASLDPGTPPGWTQSVDPDGLLVFTSDITQEQWIKSVDDRGQTYYYLRDGSKSQWNLPELSMTSQLRMGNGVNQEGASVFKNWRHTVDPSQFSSSHDDLKFLPTHKRNVSDHDSDASSSGNSSEQQHHPYRFRHRRNPSVQSYELQQHNILEKAGILNKTKVSENGKKLRKNWTPSWTVLHGGILTFHKDPKSVPAGSSNKINQIAPEFTVELRGATISRASRDKSSKKNVLELKTRTGAEFLMQYDTESTISDWHRAIAETIQQLELHSYEEEDGDSLRKSVNKPGALVTDPEQKKVRTKLLKFLQKRPTLQSVKEKGYIKDNVFGCPLVTLCAQERTTIPRFVEKCINAVEKRGLDIDGLYRVSGNLAVIQKLRHKADHDELDLEDGQWEDVHVITGALKLFFRELPEPLFPYSYFNNFIAAIKISDYNEKVAYMSQLVKSLPAPNHDTMELLFSHLRRVIEYGEANRMSVQNVAIVFGPTLLKPETESANITMYMVFQNQIVELILNEYNSIF
ncbi:rho GTPase-activating protein 27-like isoform X2 [Brienomyrus brachyistius]|uniref:rho GTPase-activating protein 27-like isoform X2 n=1 Tax=Brienomyrus brachyistius TaxID=42636 RepID=UPI0020B29B33|nr:rho GTPase-activating protein 27-like isoform X2 [Brienomyrus brachyistius]